MHGKKDLKGKSAMRPRVSIADEDYSPPSRPATPGPSNSGRSVSQGSPAPSHVSSASQTRSRSNHDGGQPATSAPSAAPSTAAAPASAAGSHIPANRYSAIPTPVPQAYNAWRPYVALPQGGIGTPFTPMVNQFAMAAPQPAAPKPVNPPDELGPPPPPPPPPAIPPVVNPMGVHFQPQVPGTEMGPMVHRYVPRQDPLGAPGMFYPGQPMAGYMANGTVMPIGVNIASVTAPMNPIVLQQPLPQPMVIQNHSVQGGPPLILPGAAVTAAQAVPMPGNAPLLAGLPAQPPVHVEPAMGVGLTPNETIAENIRIAQNNKAYEPQDFKPADPDPYRMYWFRELNGHWAVFPRRQIDRLNARWYRTDEGLFYAIRLPDES